MSPYSLVQRNSEIVGSWPNANPRSESRSAPSRWVFKSTRTPGEGRKTLVARAPSSARRTFDPETHAPMWIRRRGGQTPAQARGRGEAGGSDG